MCAISLLWCKGEVERLAFSQVGYLLLEGWQSYSHAANEDEWAPSLVCSMRSDLPSVMSYNWYDTLMNLFDSILILYYYCCYYYLLFLVSLFVLYIFHHLHAFQIDGAPLVDDVLQVLALL